MINLFVDFWKNLQPTIVCFLKQLKHSWLILRTRIIYLWIAKSDWSEYKGDTNNENYLSQVQINILTLSRISLSFGKQDWLKGECQIEVLNLIPKQTENRQGTRRSCSLSPIIWLHKYIYDILPHQSPIPNPD